MNANSHTSRQKIVLLITLGAQDVKLWKQTENEIVVERLTGPQLRVKHLAIRKKPEAWTVLARSATEVPEETSGMPKPDAQALASELGCSAPVFSSDGRLCLSVAKIEPIVEGIIARNEELEVIGALLFYTERLLEDNADKDDSYHYWNEPVASGDVGAAYLSERLKLAPDRIKIINCLEGLAGRYEGGIDEHDDFPLRRAIVARMDQAVSDFIQEKIESIAPNIIPVTMTTGGVDAFKQIVPALAELRFKTRVRDLSAPETENASAPVWENLVAERLCTERPRITRHEAIAARGRALELVRQGDPVSAWAAVHRYRGSRLDDWWLEPLAATAAYFGGAGSVQIDDTVLVPRAPGNSIQTDCWREALDSVRLSDEDELTRHRQFAVNAAMRVELALQGSNQESRRYAEALMAICTFVDAAVIAQAIKFLRETEGAKKTIENWLRSTGVKRRTFFLKDDSDTPNNSRDAWFGNLLGKEADSIAEVTELAKKMREHFGALRALDIALGRQKNKTNLRALRNDASHRALSQEAVGRISELGAWEKVAVWRTNADKLGQHSLSCADKSKWPGHIDAVLASIGIKDIEGRYERLMGSLESILLTCEPETDP